MVCRSGAVSPGALAASGFVEHCSPSAPLGQFTAASVAVCPGVWILPSTACCTLTAPAPVCTFGPEHWGLWQRSPDTESGVLHKRRLFCSALAVARAVCLHCRLPSRNSLSHWPSCPSSCIQPGLPAHKPLSTNPICMHGSVLTTLAIVVLKVCVGCRQMALDLLGGLSCNPKLL